MCGRSTYLMTVKPPQIRTPRSVASPARASSPMGMLPPTVRERGLLRYSARQRAPACFYTSYSAYLAAAGTYAPPPPQPRGAPSAAPSSVRRSPPVRSDSAQPPFSISHSFIFLPALVWPGYRVATACGIPDSPTIDSTGVPESAAIPAVPVGDWITFYMQDSYCICMPVEQYRIGYIPTAQYQAW